MNRILLVLIFFCIFSTVFAQTGKEFEQRKMAWFGYFNQTRFTDKSGLWVDLHLRLNDDYFNEVHAVLARAAYIYYFNDKTRLDVGYAYQNQPGHRGAEDVLEHRPWQQIQWFEKKARFTMMQWIRLEQRYRAVGQEAFAFANHRARYNIALSIPLTKKEMGPKTPFIFMNNEVFINFGKNVINNYFDQNRFFVGGGYQFTDHLNLQVGYMNVFQQLPAGNKYVNTDAIRLFVFHSIDLRDKE
jgi:hypothetical protein